MFARRDKVGRDGHIGRDVLERDCLKISCFEFLFWSIHQSYREKYMVRNGIDHLYHL